VIDKRELPEGWFREVGSALILEANPGPKRCQFLRDALAEAQANHARAWLLDCRFEDGGPWAGVQGLFTAILSEILHQRPDLVEKHDYELVHLLPHLRRSIKVRNPNLTDLSPPEEKVRNYPADRAFRIVHGLVDLLDSWKAGSEKTWVLACDGLDRAGHIGGVFFRELLRRRGRQMRLMLLAAVAPGGEPVVRKILGQRSLMKCLAVELPEAAPEPVNREVFAQAALDLDFFVAEDRLRMQIHLVEILRMARLGRLPDLEFKWKVRALEIYSMLGLYADALVYGEDVQATIATNLKPVHESVQWAIFLNLIICYLGLRQAETARQLAEEMALKEKEFAKPEWRCQLCYLLAMLHARYLPRRNTEKAEVYLDEGLRILDEATDLAEDKLNFQYAFNRNGLALVRHFQGRFEEAIRLCELSQERLEKHLAGDRHRLHRSALLYNLSQVYAVIGEQTKGISYLSAAIEKDPNYSEYYNDRGNLYLRLRQPVEACRDYLKAIELSPPYCEVNTNLGQCYRLMGQFDAAYHAYSVAVDLDPYQSLAYAGRAQCHDAMGRLPEAIADYSAALSLEPDQWDLLASRAVALYGVGDLAASLCDLDQAIKLEPESADLYQNRAVALGELGRSEEAARDLETYLRLQPHAGDRGEVAVQIIALRGLAMDEARHLGDSPKGTALAPAAP
jgi:tetratricopeptide (TPR) repeat protein